MFPHPLGALASRGWKFSCERQVASEFSEASADPSQHPIMMWNNAGSFLAPRRKTTGYAVASSGSDPPSGGDEAEDIDFTVTTPLATPCALSITRRNLFYGSTEAAQRSFFAHIQGVVQEADVQPPRFVHEVNKMHALLYALLTHTQNHSYKSFGEIT